MMCSQPRHMGGATTSTNDFIMGYVQEGKPCHKCAYNRRFNHVRPGEIFSALEAASSRSERDLADKLGSFFELAMPGINALMYNSEYRGSSWGRPDIILPGLRVVVEFDGTGLADIDWGHDTPEGREADIDKDTLTRAVGWEVVRIRTGGIGKLGHFDLDLLDGNELPVEDVAWQILLASMELKTLDDNMGCLKEAAQTLLTEGR